MDPEERQAQLAEYEPPQVVEVGEFAEMTKGQYSRGQSDDSGAGGYYSP